MAPTRKQQEQALELLIAGGLTALGIVVGSPSILGGFVSAAAGIGGNWAADLAQRGFYAWRDRWLRRGVLNQDIARALAHAFLRAVDDLEDTWTRTPRYHQLQRTDPDAARLSLEPLRSLREQTRALLGDPDRLQAVLARDDVHDLLSGDAAKIQIFVARQVDAYFYGHDPELIALVRKHLPDLWLLHFRDVLKTDDDVGTRAWRAVQMLWYESLTVSLAQMSSDMHEVVEATRALRAWAERVQTLPADHRDPTGMAALDQALRPVLERVEEVKSLVMEVHEDVRAIRQHLEESLAREAREPGRGLFTIPPPPQDFTGREEELDELLAHFERGALISGITGAAGIGKTALARALARRLADRFPDARLEIDLKGAARPPEQPLSPEEAMRALLRPFYPGQSLPDDPSELVALYRSTFAQRRALLLLDNARDAAQVRPLIPPEPSAAIVTSRQRFHLAGLHPLDLDVLPPDDARTLLRRVAPRLQGEPDERVDKLAQLSGYLPLALRVAAARYQSRPDWRLDRFLERLETKRLALLRLPGDRDLDVEAAIALSYEMLDDALQARFRRLAVFEAPFDVLAARAVWGHCGEATDARSLPPITPLDEEEADEALGALLRLHLLEYEEESDLYALHDLVRLFAWQRLLEDPEEALAAVRAHAWHYLAVGDTLDDMYKEGGEKVAIAVQGFAAIWPHLDAAWHRLLPPEPGQEREDLPRPPDADLWLNALPDRVAYVLDLHLSPQEKIPYLEAALAAARRLGDRQAQGVHLGNLGGAYHALGEVRRAIDYYQQALAIAREIGDRRGEGNRLGNLGGAYYALGDVKRAIEYYEQALAIARETGDRRGEGAVLGNLGGAYHTLGDIKRAIKYYEQALTIARETGDRRGEGADLGNLGRAYHALGDVKRAIKCYRQAQAIFGEINARREEGSILGNLGGAYYALGDMQRAIEYYEQALAIARETGDRRGEGADLGNLGRAYHALGDYKRAIDYYQQALVIAHEIGDRRNEGTWLGNLGLAYHDLGDVQRAIDYHQQALAIFRDIGYRYGEAMVAWNLGLIFRKQRRYVEACKLMHIRVDYERSIGHPDAEKDAKVVEEVCKEAGESSAE